MIIAKLCRFIIGRKKDEAFQVFKNFRAEVENETREKVKTFRTNCGGEFLSNQFTRYYEKTSLDRHYSTPFSPQRNGVVEERNQTILDMVKSCLKTMSVLDMLWGEAVSHSVYVFNIVNTKALKDTNPYEIWNCRKPYVKHLRVFGCVAHMMIAKGYLKKLNDRSKGLFILELKKVRKHTGYRIV